MLQLERIPQDYAVLQHVSSPTVTQFLCERLAASEKQRAPIVRLLNSVVLRYCEEISVGEESPANNERVDTRAVEDSPTFTYNVPKEGRGIGESVSAATHPQSQKESWEIFCDTLRGHIGPIANAFASHHTKTEMNLQNGPLHLVGPGTIELISFFSAIAGSQNCQPLMLECIARSVLSVSLKLFFDYGWNTILHNSVKQLFVKCMKVPDSVADGGLGDIELLLSKRGKYCVFPELVALGVPLQLIIPIFSAPPSVIAISWEEQN